MADYYFYPDSDAETNSVDGIVRNSFIGIGEQTWATIHSYYEGVTDAGDDGQTLKVNINNYDLGEFLELYRSILLFDTSSLPSDFDIGSATLRIYCDLRGHSNMSDYSIAVYESTPASNTALAATDFDNVGSTLCSNIIAGDDVPDGGYVTFILNSYGRSKINKDGITKFSLREATWDAPDSAPSISGAASCTWIFRSADYGGTTRPRLHVTDKTGGYIWVEGTSFAYLDENREKRTQEGTKAGATGQTAGHLWVEGDNLRYIDSSGDERYIAGTTDGATGKTAGHIWIEATKFRYIDSSGNERYIEGST